MMDQKRAMEILGITEKELDGFQKSLRQGRREVVYAFILEELVRLIGGGSSDAQKMAGDLVDLVAGQLDTDETEEALYQLQRDLKRCWVDGCLKEVVR